MTTLVLAEVSSAVTVSPPRPPAASSSRAVTSPARPVEDAAGQDRLVDQRLERVAVLPLPLVALLRVHGAYLLAASPWAMTRDSPPAGAKSVPTRCRDSPAFVSGGER